MPSNPFLSGITGFFGDVSRARRAANTYAALAELSDADLQARGLTRDGLSRYAFDKAFGGK